VSESYRVADLDASFVGTTVAQSLEHPAQGGLRRTLAGRNDTASDPAHRASLYVLSVR
jgi:hypothetical protein